MSSSSTKCKIRCGKNNWQEPFPFAKVDIYVWIDGENYTIDMNTIDILEGDKITVNFDFKNWDAYPVRKCAVIAGDKMDVFDISDGVLRIPDRLVVNHNISLYVKGYEGLENGQSITIDMFETPIKIGSWYDR